LIGVGKSQHFSSVAVVEVWIDDVKTVEFASL
jgi:hypothetical protein